MNRLDKLKGFEASGWNLLEPFSVVSNGCLRVEIRSSPDL